MAKRTMPRSGERKNEEEKFMDRHGMSGITLIEILIIIAILGVLAAVCVPNLMALLGR